MRGVSNGRRVLAYIIDLLIVEIIILSPLKNKIDINSLLVSIQSNNLILIGFLSAVLSIMYWVILEYKLRQTIGGMIMKIKVKSEKKNLEFIDVFIRNISKMSCFILIIDSINVLFSDKKQRFSEKWSRTLTVENG